MTETVRKVTDRITGKAPGKNKPKRNLEGKGVHGSMHILLLSAEKYGISGAAVSGWDALEE